MIMKTTIKKKIIISASLLMMLVGSVAGYMYYLYLSTYPVGIDQPFAGTIPFESQVFNADSGLIFHRPTGTHIEIPANAFEDSDGNIVKGKIELKFREFHSGDAILLSGIPMQQADERNMFMQSSGMVELRAFKDGKELNLSSNKTVNIDLASNERPTADHKLFYLKDDERWEEGGGYKTGNNVRRDSALSNLPERPIIPKDPEPDTSDFVFELSANYKLAPYLKPFRGVSWKIVVDQGEEIPYWALRVGWDNINLKEIDKKNNIYQIDFSWSRDTYKGSLVRESCSIKAVPLLKGKKLKEAKSNFLEEMKNYEEVAALVEKEEERLMEERALINSFAINQMGVFNIDAIKNFEVFARVELEFDFENEYSPIFNKVMLIMVMEDLNSVVKINAFKWDQIPFIDTSTELIAILPNGEVARVSPEDFRNKVNKETVKPLFTNKFHFTTERIKSEDYFEIKSDQGYARPML